MKDFLRRPSTLPVVLGFKKTIIQNGNDSIKIDDLILSLQKRVRLEDVTKSRDHREIFQINQADDHRDSLRRQRFRQLENRVY